MTAAGKRARLEEGDDSEQQQKGGRNEAAADTQARHAAAAATPVTPATAVAAAAPAAAAASSAASASDASGSDSDSDSDSDVSEYVVVRMPASLVNHMREHESSVVLHALDSEQPHFSATYTYAAAPNALPGTPAAHTGTTTHKYVGAYEYSVGTQMLWRIHAPAVDPMSSASLHLSSRSSIAVGGGTTGAPPAAATHEAAAKSPSPVPAAVPAQPAPPILSNGPQIELMGKTWKRLLFARQR